jgi:hypothetical protein
MCNLCSMTNNVDAIRRLFRALNSRVGNLPSCPASSRTTPLRSCATLPRVARSSWPAGQAVITGRADGSDQKARAKVGGQGPAGRLQEVAAA